MTWLHSTHDLDAATAVLAALGGIYGYYAFAGKPAGLVRQLLDAVLAATVFGSAAFVYDEYIHLHFSATLRDLLASPAAALPSAWAAAIYFGLLGFSIGFTPSVRSLVSVAQGVALPVAVRVATNAMALVVQSLTFILAAQIALVTFHVIPGFQPPLAAVVVVTVLYVVARRLYRWWRYTMLQRLRGDLDTVSKQTDDEAVTLPWVGKWAARLVIVLVGGILFTLPLAIAGVAVWGYFLTLLGWSLALFAVALLLVYVGLRTLRNRTEGLPRRALLIIAVALLVCAAGAQAYQALAV